MTLSGALTDVAAGFAAKYQWTSDYPNLDITNADTATSFASFVAPMVGSATAITLTLTVTDSGDTRLGTDTVVITVTPPPTPPFAVTGASQTVGLGATVTLNGAASQNNDMTTGGLLFLWQQIAPTSGAGSGIMLDGATSNTATFVVPPTLTTDVVLMFRLTVTDADGETDTADTTVSARANQPPTVTLAGRTVNDDGATITIIGTANDPEGTTLSYSWVVTGAGTGASSNPDLSPTGLASTNLVLVIPTQLAATITYTLTLAATDSGSPPTTTRETVTLTVTAVNDPPAAMAGADQSNIAPGATVTLRGSGTDPDPGDMLGYAWTQIGSGAPSVAFIGGGNSAVTTFIAPIQPGPSVLNFQLTVSDDDSAFTTDTVMVNVLPTTQPPVSDAGPDQTVIAGATVTLDGGGSRDPDGEDANLVYAWTQIAPPADRVTLVPPADRVTLSGANTAQPTFVAPNENARKTLSFELIVTDELDAVAAPNTVDIIVSAQLPPTADAGMNQDAKAGVTVTLKGSADDSDPAGAVNLRYKWTQKASDPQQVTLSDAAVANPTFTMPDPLGDAAVEFLTFTLRVTDRGGSGLPSANPDSDDSGDIGTVTITFRRIAEINQTINTTALPEVARALSASSTAAITQRIGQAAAGGSRSFSIGGQDTFANLLKTHGSNQDRDYKQMLGGSDFAMPLNVGGFGTSSLAFWGSGEYRNLSGDSDSLEWDGDLTGFHLGVDARLQHDTLLGVAVSRTASEFAYKEAADNNIDSGNYEVTMTSVHPYLSWQTGALNLWATVGGGSGELEITETGDATASSDLGLRTAALGVNSAPFQDGADSVRIKGEVQRSELEVEMDDDTNGDIAPTEVNATRVRLAMEARHSSQLADGSLFEPSVELAARYDGGDGETGSGAELGARLWYSNPASGVTVDGRAHAVLGHSSGYAEWGVQGTVRIQPGADQQGLSFTLTPGYGNPPSGSRQLWQQGVAEDKPATTSQYHPHLTTRLAWGMPQDNNAVLTPYTSLTLNQTNTLGVGITWSTGRQVDIDLLTERVSPTNTPTDHTIHLKGTIRF